MVIYRLQVLFWGVRELRRLSQLQSIDRPVIEIECGGHVLRSNVIRSYRKHSNFAAIVRQMDVRLPQQSIYCPPLAIRVLDCKSFGRSTLLGCHSAPLLAPYTDRKARALVELTADPREINIRPEEHMYAPDTTAASARSNGKFNTAAALPTVVEGFEATDKHGEHNPDEIDWWTRYFASRQAQANQTARHRSSAAQSIRSNGSSSNSIDFNHNIPDHLLLDILDGPLEQSDLFTRASWMDEFVLSRGKSTIGRKRAKSSLFSDSDEARDCGRFVGCVNIQKLPILDASLMNSIPNNDPTRFLVRVYVIRANDLQPSDALTGKADPFVTLQLSSGRKVSDKANYITNQLNPTFGRCFELPGQLPLDATLTIQVKDYDLIGKNELIGETKIDLESRYYSNSISLVGLPKAYLTAGPGKWRLPDKPQTLLAKLCKQHRLSMAVGHNHVRIGEIMFTFKDDRRPDARSNGRGARTVKQLSQTVLQIEHHHPNSSSALNRSLGKQPMCLAVLNCWHEAFGYRLSSEHVERRPLYHPDRATVPQGTLELFVELLPTEVAVPRHCTALDVSPRRPQSYELRVIVHNTEDVALDEVNPVTGEASSDIYVKGWLADPETVQSTDVHYRSLTGEGNFNWRFVFPFDYSLNESCVVRRPKESLFSLDDGEQKVPARVQLQVWDADFCSPDDILGSLTFDLTRLPRPAKTSAACDLRVVGIQSDANGRNSRSVSSPTAQTLNLFKQKRVKGWWPFTVKDPLTGQMTLTGKLEAELHLVTGDEAQKCPVGRARNEPEALVAPNRPDTSFTWFLSPWKTFRYVVWRNFKGDIIKVTLLALLSLFLILFVYSLPGYTANKLINSL
jgi:hypothetical protein